MHQFLNTHEKQLRSSKLNYYLNQKTIAVTQASQQINSNILNQCICSTTCYQLSQRIQRTTQNYLASESTVLHRTNQPMNPVLHNTSQPPNPQQQTILAIQQDHSATYHQLGSLVAEVVLLSKKSSISSILTCIIMQKG